MQSRPLRGFSREPTPAGSPLVCVSASGYCRIPVFWTVHTVSFSQDSAMLSARNQLPATIKSVKLGNVMAEVIMSVGDIEIVSAITRGSAEQLSLRVGDTVKAVIKATEVLIEKS
jgi:molybdopterin-binding protein